MRQMQWVTPQPVHLRSGCSGTNMPAPTATLLIDCARWTSLDTCTAARKGSRHPATRFKLGPQLPREKSELMPQPFLFPDQPVPDTCSSRTAADHGACEQVQTAQAAGLTSVLNNNII